MSGTDTSTWTNQVNEKCKGSFQKYKCKEKSKQQPKRLKM